ncbi:hypothetical protein DSECCO2_538740 [anaerobic digester metagenome]
MSAASADPAFRSETGRVTRSPGAKGPIVDCFSTRAGCRSPAIGVLTFTGIGNFSPSASRILTERTGKKTPV